MKEDNSLCFPITLRTGFIKTEQYLLLASGTQVVLVLINTKKQREILEAASNKPGNKGGYLNRIKVMFGALNDYGKHLAGQPVQQIVAEHTGSVVLPCADIVKLRVTQKGGMCGLVSLVVAIAYAVLNLKFKALFNNPLLFFEASETQHKASTAERAKAIRHSNKVNLIIMLIFCAIAAVLGPIVKDDGIIISYIALVLGLFLIVFALIATKYRIHKLQTSPHLVILAENGAYIDGELHLWRLPNLFQRAR